MTALREHGSTAIPRTRPLSGLPLSGLRWLLYPADRYRLREDPSASGYPGAVAARDCEGRAHGPPGTRVEAVTQTASYLRQRIQANLNNTAPTDVMPGTAFEADELYQNAGKKSTPHLDPEDPPRRRANKRRGHGTYANDRPPIISIISRDTGEQRFWVCNHATKQTCHDLLAENIPAGGTMLYTDEWQGYHGSHAAHATVGHRTHEWARDDDGDGRRQVHCYTCEGAGASFRTYLRAFRGVRKQYLHLYVATYEAMVNTRWVTPDLIQRMCVANRSLHSDYT